jgi:hypothetical protein
MPESFLPMENMGRKTALSTEFSSQVGNGIVRSDNPFQGHNRFQDHLFSPFFSLFHFNSEIGIGTLERAPLADCSILHL